MHGTALMQEYLFISKVPWCPEVWAPGTRIEAIEFSGSARITSPRFLLRECFDDVYWGIAVVKVT